MRWNGRMSRVALAFLSVALLADPAHAADAEGRYAIKGAGGVSCKQLAEVVTAQDERTLLLLGWLDGYVTSENRRADGLFDATPWQRVELLGELLVTHCQNRPDQPVYLAVQLMLQAMRKTSLDQESPIERIEVGEGQSLEIYRKVLERAQRELVAKGFLDGGADGRYGPKTAAALAAFQTAAGLEVTRVPDQSTLLALFRGLFGGE